MSASTNVAELFATARARGQEQIVGVVVPPGLELVSSLVGLVSQSIELGKLRATEERDLQVIESHYQIEMARIQVEFSLLQTQIVGEFREREGLRTDAFAFINRLADAGHFDLAMQVYTTLMETLKPTRLGQRLAESNRITGNAGSRFSVR